MWVAQAEAALLAAQAEAQRLRKEAEDVRAAARSEAERLEAERKKLLSDQATRDAAHAAAEEQKSRALLESVSVRHPVVLCRSACSHRTPCGGAPPPPGGGRSQAGRG